MLKITHILRKVAPKRHLFRPIVCKTTFKHFVAEKNSLRNLIYPELSKYNKYFSFKSHSFLSRPILFAVSILTWLGFDQDEEEKESELIMTLKRAVLCTQREEYEKAEQMLHLALRIAQQQQNQQGILYCYDLMANLAFNTYNLDKAEKLFVTVLQLLLGGGIPEDDIKVIHISLKLARICQLKANIERADIGYKWCLEQIEHHDKDNEDAKLLYGVINDWYAQYLLDIGNSAQALMHLNEAYKVCNEIEGITSFRAEDYNRAEKFLQEAINVGNKLEDKSHLGVIHANLGLILLQKGIYKEAEKSCNEGKKLGKLYEHTESIEQSNYCLDQLKMNMGS
ncbi:tetratricopeptide repeat protein 19 homolog, mitochondrial isoform X4 [Euwallacea similis]|uniref:tetratricopeptide repeat protein 19 homolog, mitochondrial isoform X4 n=1 Tax=Euwallacea similis TaxID=1736056 RepID=UPI00344D8D1F